MPKPPARHKRLPSRSGALRAAAATLAVCAPYGLLSPAVAEQAAPEPAYDWHPKASLSAEQQALVGPGCDGLYIDPIAPLDTPENADIRNLPLNIEADSSTMIEGDTAILEGNVEVSQGSRQIRADKMTYDIDGDTASLEGSVSIRQPGLLLRGSGASANGADHSARFDDARFVLHQHHLRGGAASISQSPDKVITLQNGQFTSCEPGNKTWLLEGEEIRINTESQWGEGRNVKLKVADIPLIYLPYITFPVGDQRKSGFLFPSVSVSEENGLDISAPYYLNLAPNYDMTLIPRYIGKRGAMLEVEGRHLSSHLDSLANIAFLANDRGGRDPDLESQIDQGLISQEEATPYRGENRWLAHFQQSGGRNRNWYSQIHYTRVSDNDYFRDLGNSSFSVQNTTHLDQSIQAGVQFNNWELSGLAQDYQVLLYDVDDPYRRLPQVNLNGRYQLGGVSTSLLHEATRFDHGDDFWRNGQTIIKGHRLNTDYRLGSDQQFAWGFIKPQMGLQSLHYQLDENTISGNANANPGMIATLASLDAGMVFEHPGGKIMQTLEPRLFYLYRSYADHSDLFNVTDDGQNVNFDTSERTFSYSQLYRDSRFIGKDRLDDANRMTLGISSNWYGNESGREYLSVSLGQIIHFDNQRVSLEEGTHTVDKSEFAGDMRVRLGPLGRLYSSAVYDAENGQFKRGDAGIQIATENAESLYNLGYSYIRQESAGSTGIDQIDASFVTPLNRQWHVMGRYNYDFGSKTELETFLGFEYNDCCYRVRLLARRWLDSNVAPLAETSDALYDSGLFFEIHLKGLGSSGARVNSILEDSIYGYREREEHLNQ